MIFRVSNRGELSSNIYKQREREIDRQIDRVSERKRQ